MTLTRTNSKNLCAINHDVFNVPFGMNSKIGVDCIKN